MVQQGQHRRVRPPRASSHLRIAFHPKPDDQLEYNRIREEEDRQASHNAVTSPSSNNNSSLRPPPMTAPPMSRSSTSDSRISTCVSPTATSSSPGQVTTTHTATLAPGPARKTGERGKRKRALTPTARAAAHIRRKLKLVCEDCKTRKVKCEHYDLSELEKGYQACKNRPQQLNNAGPVSPSLTYIFGEFSCSAPIPMGESPAGDIDLSDLSQLSSNPRQHVQQIANDFDVASVTFHESTTQNFSSPYYPGFGPAPALQRDISAAFAIGSAMEEFPNRWQCEFDARRYPASVESSPDECSWTGSLNSLNNHFSAEHHPFCDPEIWWQCRSCRILSRCSIPPAGNGYCQHSWKQWCYAYLTDSPTASTSTPAVTLSFESESIYSYDEISIPGIQTSLDEGRLLNSPWDVCSTHSGSVMDPNQQFLEEWDGFYDHITSTDSIQ